MAASLIKMNNFNSAYAVYLALSNVWVKNYVEMAKIRICPLVLSEFEKIRQIFVIDNRQLELKRLQMSARYPMIPFLGVYLQEILYLCEKEKTTQTSTGKINIFKFRTVHKIMEKVLNIKNYPYNFYQDQGTLQLLETLPSSQVLETLVSKKYDILVEKMNLV